MCRGSAPRPLADTKHMNNEIHGLQTHRGSEYNWNLAQVAYRTILKLLWAAFQGPQKPCMTSEGLRKPSRRDWNKVAVAPEMQVQNPHLVKIMVLNSRINRYNIGSNILMEHIYHHHHHHIPTFHIY